MRKHGGATRAAVGLVVALLLAAACSNSKSSGDGPKVTTGGPAATTAPAADLTKFVPGRGPGVDDNKKEIRVAVITTKTNPIGGKYAQYTDGIKAYFDKLNAAGGIYGRKLVVVSDRDDTIGLQNTQQVTQSLAEDNAFATFVATLQFGGATKLAAANQPTFIWNINPEMAGKNNIFGDRNALCFNCAGQFLPWIAKKNGFTKVGILAYNAATAAQSVHCAEGDQASFDTYGGDIKVAFKDTSLGFAADLSTDVGKMKDAGVQMIMTCMDTAETLKLAKELKKQNLNAIQLLPNAYDHEAIAGSNGVFDGSYVSAGYASWEATPQSPATKEFLDYVQAHNITAVELTETGWIQAQQFVDGLKLAGPEFTKQKVIDALNTQTAESPGGLIKPIDWTQQHNDPQEHPETRAKEDCFSLMKIENNAFVAQYTQPGKPWICFSNDPKAPLPDDPIHRSYAPGGEG